MIPYKTYQVDACVNGIGTDTKISKKPGQTQRIVLDYMQWYTYFAHADDLIQVDTYGVAVEDRKTLFYVNPTAAVHYAPGAAMLNIKLYPNEWFQVYVRGVGATSSLNIQVWYHIEDLTAEMNAPEYKKSCDLFSFIGGKCYGS